MQRVGQLIAEGKTKLILTDLKDSSMVFVTSKDSITAGDGAKKDVIQGKAELSTRTTSNVFRLLKTRNIPVAFEEQVHETTFRAPRCEMLPYEVVIRREAHGSYLDRHPEYDKGFIFPELVLEFFLKTSDKVWKGERSSFVYPLLKDDPLMDFNWEKGRVSLFYPTFSAQERKIAPKDALVGQGPFWILPLEEISIRANEREFLEQMGEIAKKTFLILEEIWKPLKRRLVDFKLEFGLDLNGKILLADVVDNDSWRLINEAGEYDDKQFYREDGDLDEVTAKYRRVADLTDQFIV